MKDRIFNNIIIDKIEDLLMKDAINDGSLVFGNDKNKLIADILKSINKYIVKVWGG